MQAKDSDEEDEEDEEAQKGGMSKKKLKQQSRLQVPSPCESQLQSAARRLCQLRCTLFNKALCTRAVQLGRGSWAWTHSHTRTHRQSPQLKQIEQQSRLQVAALKQLCPRPEVVEVWDVTAPDPQLLVYLKARLQPCCAARLTPPVQLQPMAARPVTFHTTSLLLVVVMVVVVDCQMQRTACCCTLPVICQTAVAMSFPEQPAGRTALSAHILLLPVQAYRNTVPVPRHWSQKRKFLQGKRGIEKPGFALPDYIEATGISEMRKAYQEKVRHPPCGHLLFAACCHVAQ